MKHIFLTAMLFAWSFVATAESGVKVENAWVREAPPTARMMAAYMTLKNTGEQETVLVEVGSTAFRHVMLHKSEVIDGVARMMHLDELIIPAQGSVELKPGSYHLMMPAPDTRLSAGDSVDFILTFADGNSITVRADVQKKP